MRILAKTYIDEQEFASKSKYVCNNVSEYSCDGLEIHLQAPGDIDELSRHSEWFRDIYIIHMPMKKNEEDLFWLEDINSPAFAHQFRDLFQLAQKIYRYNNGSHRVGIVIHIQTIDSVPIDVIRTFREILRDLEIDIYVENLDNSINTYSRQDAVIAFLKLETGYNRIYPCVDICHTIMNWNRGTADMGDDTYWEFLKHYFFLFPKYQGGLIHLSSIRGDGYGPGKHGIPFDLSNKFDNFLMENIVDLYNSMCSPYDLPITIEVWEPSSEAYIKGHGYINTCALLKKNASKYVDACNLANIRSSDTDNNVFYRKNLAAELPDIEGIIENDVEQANFVNILQGERDGEI